MTINNCESAISLTNSVWSAVQIQRPPHSLLSLLISAAVRRELFMQLCKWEEQDLIDTIELFSRVPGAAGVTRTLVECHRHYRFYDKITIVAVPMFRTSHSESRWHAAFGDFAGSSLLCKAKEKALSAVPPPVSIPLSISPSKLRVYDPSGPLAIEENIYYIMVSNDQVPIDSFIVHAGHLYLFQFTISQEHCVSDGLSTMLSQITGLPAPGNQHFATFDCPHTDEGFLHNHSPICSTNFRPSGLNRQSSDASKAVSGVLFSATTDPRLLNGFCRAAVVF